VNSPEDPDGLHELLTMLGLLLYRWSVFEQALSQEIKRFRLAGGDSEASLRVRASASERLGEWQALIGQRARRDAALAKTVSELSTRIQRNRRNRNLIACDFEAVAPASSGKEASISCSGPLSGQPASTMRSFTVTELQRLVQDIDACSEQLIELGAEVLRRRS
jgi:hypothetical protein